jgi:lycopene beta-cyclase
MTTSYTDVVVVGDGPAGTALAHGCARRGVDTVLVGMGQPWAATYGCWVDDLEPAADDLGSVADLFAVTMPDVAVVTDRRQILARSYGVLDNDAVRQRFLTGLDHRWGRVARVEAVGAGHEVELADRSAIRCRLVIDATGWPSGLVPPGRIEVPAWQTGIGVVLPEPPSGDLGTPTLMDFRAVHAAAATGESTFGPVGVATFAYSIPVRDGWLVEETVLAARQAVEPISLLARLAARLGRHPDTLLGDAVRSEYVRIPMGTPIATLPAPSSGTHAAVVPFGAAAGYINPATGYSVASSLRAVPRVADAIAAAMGDARHDGAEVVLDRDAVWDAVWPTAMRRTRVFHDMGLSMLLRLDAAGQMEFFSTFFDLPPERWSEFLRIDAAPSDIAAVMAEVFRSSSWSLRRRLAGGNPAALARLLRP